MIITYAHCTRFSAQALADECDEVELVQSSATAGVVNWGRAHANTELNSDISTVTNKRTMRELFAAYDVPAPKLYTIEEARRKAREGYLLVGRPDTHMKGRGFWKIRNINSFLKARRGTRRKKAATHFMEYIEAPREYRVHIFKGKSLRISEKSHIGNNFTTLKPRHSVDHVRDAAKKAVAAVGLDFGAVDVLADDNRCWVTEVNAAPGIGGSMPRMYIRAFNKHRRGEW